MSKIRDRVLKTKLRKVETERKRNELEALRNDTRKMTVVMQDWTEREAGWGMRPDGFSLHLNKAQMEAYNKQYLEKERKRNPSGVTPNEYSHPDGYDLVDIPMIAYVALQNSENGLRFWNSTHFEREFGVKLES